MLFTSKPTIDFSQYDPDILDTLKQDSSAWTYDLFDAEDLQRKSMGIMPKSVESSYDLDDPIDKYLYEQGYVSRNKFSKGYQQAEKDNAAKANFSTEVQKNAAQKLAQYREEDPSYSEKEAYEKAFEELRKTDAYKNLIKSDDLESYFKNYVKDSMQNKLTEQSEDEVLQAMMDRTIGTGRTLSSVSLPQTKTDTGRQKEAAMRLASNMAGKDYSEKEITAPIIPGTKAWETMITETLDDITQSNAEEKARIRTDAVFYNGEESEARKKEIDKRIKEINRVLNRGQGVQQTYIDPDKRNSQLQERNALQAELSALQAERDTIVAGRNAEKLVDFFKIPEQSADFAQYSEYDPAKAKTEGVLYSFINGENPAETSVLMPMGINAPSSTSDPDYAFAYMNGEERSIYNYLVNTDKNSDEYLEALRPYLNQRMRAAVEREASEYAAEKPVLSSLETIVTSPVSAIEGLIGLGKTGYNAITGQDTDPNDPVFQNTRRSAAIRNTVSNTIRTENQGFVGEALAMLYQTGMSMGDTAVRLPMGAAGLGVAGLSASASAMDDALSRGATSGQALASGLMTGAAEVVFEKASLDNLVSMSRAGNIRDIVKNILKQGGVEASEEVFTEIANTISDAVIMADKSAYEIAVRDYMADGMTEQVARQLASMDSFKAILDAGVGGFLSGGGFGMGGSASSAIQTARIGANVDAQVQIAQGLTMPQDSAAFNYADKIADVKAPSILQAGQQFILNQEAIATGARTEFESNVRASGIGEENISKAMYLYDRLAEGRGISPRDARTFAKLKSAIETTNIKRAEAEAELGVTRLEIKTKLDQTYEAMTEAVEKGNQEAFNKAKARYMAEYQVARAKTAAAELKAENQNTEASRKAENAVNEMVAEAAAEDMRTQAEALNRVNFTPINMEETNGNQNYSIPQRTEGERQTGIPAGVETARIAEPAAGSEENTGRNQRTDARIRRGLEPTPEAEEALSAHREVVKRATGADINSRIVNEVNEADAEMLDMIKSITGRDAFLYESDDSYGDGFAKNGKIFLRVNGSSHLAFLSGHEAAHADQRLVEAGMSVIENMAKSEIEAYAEYRRAEVGEDGADIERELISDMFGRMMFEVATGHRAEKDFGISEYTIGRFYDAFLQALSPDLETGGYVGEVAHAAADAMNVGGIEYSRTRINQITPFSNVTAQRLENMSDAERADELVPSVVAVPTVDLEAIAEAEEQYERTSYKLRSSEAATIIRELAKKFKSFGVYENENVEVEFELTGGGLNESISQQINRTGSTYDLARLIPILADVVNGAVPIETHQDVKKDHLKRVYVLFSAFNDEGNMIPVQLEVKEYKDSNKKPKLYVVVTLNNKKTGVAETGVPQGNQAASRPVFNIKLADIIKDVNPSNGDFLMYLPDQMLSEEQRLAKWDAIDKRYLDAVKNGKEHEAAQRVKLAARNAGYNTEAYHGSRALFNAFSEEKLGSNTRTKSSERWFFAGDKETANSYYPYGTMKELARQNPNIWKESDAEKLRQKGKLYHLYLKIENPLKVDAKGYDYAAHAENKDAFMEYVVQAERDGNDGLVITNARDNQLRPRAEESTVYMFRSPSQAKSADTITYDDEGNVIPLSKRFNTGEPDMRYSRITFSDPDAYVDKDGKVMEYSYVTPTIKENSEGFYADVTIDGQKTRMTGNDKATLEAEIRELKQKERMRHLSRPVKILREANRLFKNGMSVEEYSKMCQETGQEYDVAVARALMGIQLRNGMRVGGQLSNTELNDILEDSDQWKDKGALSYGRETLVRNLEDIAPTAAKGRKLVETYWQPIDQGVADMTRWMRKWSETIGALNLDAEESAMVQLVGEGRVEGDVLKNGLLREDGTQMDAAKIQNAVDTFRKFYAEALRMANDALIRNGYKPVHARANYFPHIDELTSDWQSFVNDVVRGGADALPTEISGMTEIFQPGKKWFRNFQQRLGDETEYDAVRGFSKYLEGIGQVIFLTDGIQRIRQLEKAIRAKYGMEDGNKELEKSDLTGKEKTQHLSQFAAWLLEYGNQLAGKTARVDRAIESAFFGRKSLAALGWLKRRFGANAVGGNLSTALSNFIPLTQGLATMQKSAFLNGMRAAVSRQVRNDGLWEHSNFLTKRFGRPDALTVQHWKLGWNPKNIRIKGSIEAQKASQKLSWLFELVDRFTAETLVFGKYEEFVKQGIDPAEAMKRADEYAERTMAGRTIGSVPTLMNSKTLGLFTQFQLEVNNQMSNIIKDIPRQYGDRKKIFFALLQLFIYSFLYNEINERFLTGRRPAFDPINVLVEAVNDFTNPDVKKGDAIINTVMNIAEQLPLGQLLVGGGRIPLASALEGLSVADLVRKAGNGENIQKELLDWVSALAYNFALPAGGGQIKKWVTGGKALVEGGRYYGDQLAYPVKPTAGNIVSSVLFGPSAVEEGRDFYANGGKPLSEKKTEAYKELVESGVDQHDAYEALQNYGGNTNAAKLTSLAEADVDERTRKLIAKAMGLTLGEGTIKSQAKTEAKEYLADKEKQYRSGKITKADLEDADKKTQDLIKRLLDIK